MSKTWYNKTTGEGAVFDDAEDMSNWPDFQETKPLPTEAEVRAERDELLQESDNMALADRITDAWKIYRQALRDVPQQSGFPSSVTWPTEPS
tara:strand:- start:108 stop:383 length:276 start_codon:yes stop_codon:yes gene_type:complete